MFKGILPSSKRISNSEFEIISPAIESAPLNINSVVGLGKENYNAFPVPPASKPQPAHKFMQKRMMSHSKPKDDQPVETNQAFDKLLDDLQIPSTLRPKLTSMESSVKAAMLKSSQTLASAPQSPTPRGLRRAHSSDSINSPRPPKQPADYDLSNAWTTSRNAGNLMFAETSVSHSRFTSMDITRPASRAQTPSGHTRDSAFRGKSKDKSSKAVSSPVAFCSILDNTSSALLEVETVKKLRLLLRNEAASWTEEFLEEGGYDALLNRFSEILEFEWREEQHDDQLLHALLQCFKALSTSDAGCSAIRASFPMPFVQLITLLYSDKKPGEVATKQLIVEFVLVLFELYPSDPLVTNNDSIGHREEEPTLSSNLISLPAPHESFFSLIRSLLLTRAPLPSEVSSVPVSPHEFIENLHKPRIYKTYLQELSDVCRDYFWVFCHPSNTIWNLRECDEEKAERPRAPGGMTGGVEAEAMRYMTTHFKFLNLIARSAAASNLAKEHEHSSYMFHNDLFLSGIERILLIARKASTLYYPTLHLELSRYVQFAMLAQYELPWSISRLIGPPPAAMSKTPSVNAAARSAPSSPSKRRESYVETRNVTPLNF